MKKIKLIALLMLAFALGALTAARAPGVYDAVRYIPEAVVLHEGSGCTLNHYPYLLDTPWVVFSPGGGEVVFAGAEIPATRVLLNECPGKD
jgi:hypothetical protein